MLPLIWEALPAWVLPLFCIVLTILTAPCADGVPTQTPHLWIIGFTAPDFASTDYFPLPPWLFVFLFGTWAGRYVKDGRLPQGIYTLRAPHLALVRRHALLIYLLHQPVLYEMQYACFSSPFSDRRLTMHYGEIKNCDIANGEGVRVTLFVSGCTNHCKNCFQPQTWAFDYGQPFTAETEETLLSLLAPPYINGLTLLGGEPFEPANQRALLPFLRRARERLPGKTVWGFTGFTWEQLHTDGAYARCEATDELLSLLDVLVDGRYVEELHDISLRFRGSSNQRIIDVPRTLARGTITPWED